MTVSTACEVVEPLEALRVKWWNPWGGGYLVSKDGRMEICQHSARVTQPISNAPIGHIAVVEKVCSSGFDPTRIQKKGCADASPRFVP